MTNSAKSVVVMVDPSLVHRAPLHAAASLALRHGLTLTAVVVRNPNLSRLAKLPFTRELRTSSSAWKGLNDADVLRSYAGQLRRIERILHEVASEFDLSWRLEQTAGRERGILEQARQQGCLVLLDRPPLVPVDQRRRYRQVIAVCDGGMTGLATASQLAAAENILLTVLVLATDSGSFSERRQQARKILGAGVAPQWRWQVVSADAAQARQQVLRRLAHETAATQSLLVLPADSSACPVESDLKSLHSATIVIEPAAFAAGNE